MKPQSVSVQGASCPGDFNGDGKVNLADFLAFAGGFGARSGDTNYNAGMDMDGNGAIDLSDFLAFAGVFGTTCEDRPRGSVSGDRAALVALYNATDGPNWVDNTNWLTDAPLGEWYGVETDASGRVIVLDLGDLWDEERSEYVYQGLQGRIPAELVDLTRLEVLSLGRNRLSGLIPPELGGLENLTELSLHLNQLTGPIPPELGNLSNLRTLSLSQNQLTGPIPGEIASLANLTYLRLSINRLTGPIPLEFGKLSNLKRLYFSQNRLTGQIPRAFLNLSNLTILYLDENQLTGPIPDKLGSLANLVILFLNGNGLNGPIPPVLGNLSNLVSLVLAENQLTGPIPPELGNLSNLTELYLNGNRLTGPVPSNFLGLTSLRGLWLSNNPGMAGPLPTGLAALNRLEQLQAGGTNLRAPSDPGFRTWLEGIGERWIGFCSDEELPPAYLTQAVQSRRFPVPLVAGEKALLRVFPTANRATSERIPAARARFYLDGRETHVEEIPGGTVAIPMEVDEGHLDRSVNARIPGHLIQPGLEMVIEIDPEGTLDPALGVIARIPTSGRMAVEVGSMPLFDLTLIPFIWQEGGDSSIVDLIREMAADPQNHDMLADTRILLPIAVLEVRAHEPVLSSSNDGSDLHAQTKAVRVMEGAPGHYMGMMPRPVTGPSGQAQRPGRTSFSIPDGPVIAHELGHNLSLGHAPCNVNGDPRFPYPDGSIGAWGYDFTGGGRLLNPVSPDLMSYCHPQWISDYHFIHAFRYRLSDAGASEPGRSVSASRGLLLWGGVDAEGVPFMEPAFVVDSPPEVPEVPGPYMLIGRAVGDAELFTLSFDMPETGDGDGRSSFVFALPLQPEWAGNLASITLSGPGGSATLDGSTDRPMAILRDLRSGQVRGFLSDLTAEETAQAAEGVFAAKQGVEVIFSRGIPDLR
ncbi:MAG: dockerin type I domain-containing protein [Gemmatimonadota bacterium]|nr:dockerin type I domain-containing protein [Gemmatimonadota bacterium]